MLGFSSEGTQIGSEDLNSNPNCGISLDDFDSVPLFLSPANLTGFLLWQ